MGKIKFPNFAVHMLYFTHYSMKKFISLTFFVAAFTSAYSQDFSYSFDGQLDQASINKLEESSKENFEMVNSFIIKNYEFFIPLEGGFDKDAEIMKLKKELDYNEGFLKSVENKLKNENFVKNAPAAIVNIEKQKILDTRSKIKSIQKSISELS